MAELLSFVLGVVMTIGFVLYILCGKPIVNEPTKSLPKMSDEYLKSLKEEYGIKK